MSAQCDCHKEWEGSRHAHDPFPLLAAADTARITEAWTAIGSGGRPHSVQDGALRCDCGSALHLDGANVVCYATASVVASLV